MKYCLDNCKSMVLTHMHMELLHEKIGKLFYTGFVLWYWHQILDGNYDPFDKYSYHLSLMVKEQLPCSSCSHFYRKQILSIWFRNLSWWWWSVIFYTQKTTIWKRKDFFAFYSIVVFYSPYMIVVQSFYFLFSQWM